MSRIYDRLLHWQRTYPIVFILISLILGGVCAKPAIKLLNTISTDLIHLLPGHYDSVRESDEIGKRFNSRSKLFVIVASPDVDANEKAILALNEYLEKDETVEKLEIEKRGYSFFEKSKPYLMDLEDLETARDNLKREIEKSKLSSLLIDFEDENGSNNKQENSFSDLVKKYQDKYAAGVASRYLRSDDGTVYAIGVVPKSADQGIGSLKRFGKHIEAMTAKFDFKQFSPNIEYGFAGAVKTRVEQYDILLEDLARSGAISGTCIFIALFFYYAMFIRAKTGRFWIIRQAFSSAVPVTLVFLPMIVSTFAAFAFCSLFFKQLNLVTSFLFSIIFGLGIDIGIHLLARYVQDRAAGIDMIQSHQDVMHHTAKSAATSVITTVASFYVMTLTDFRGFSEFGWIAGNGLLIALACYIVFFPPLFLLADRWGILAVNVQPEKRLKQKSQHQWIPKAGLWLAGFAILTAVSTFAAGNVEFEWNFEKLKIQIPEREFWREKLKLVFGRSNSPAAFLVQDEEEASKLTRELKLRKNRDKDSPTIDFIRSYYDIISPDQQKKRVVLAEIRKMLNDDFFNAAKPDKKKQIDDLIKMIDDSQPPQADSIPEDVNEVFWGNTGKHDKSLVLTFPMPDLQMDNGKNARAFYEDIADIKIGDKIYRGVSDSMIFAEVLKTLFRDAKVAVVLSYGLLGILVALHFRNSRHTLIVLGALACGIGWMLAIMNLTGIKLNFYNMIIIPAMIGMGEDNSVHVVDRFDEHGRSSIVYVLRTSGAAAFMASMTAIFGYGGLCFAHHPGLRSIGWMAIIGLGTCLLASLVLIPLLLQIFVKAKSKIEAA